jgi:hypothetical protein
LWYLSGILSVQQEQDGFVVYEDAHLIYVKKSDYTCLSFSISGATREVIQEAVELLRSDYHTEKTLE